MEFARAFPVGRLQRSLREDGRYLTCIVTGSSRRAGAERGATGGELQSPGREAGGEEAAARWPCAWKVVAPGTAGRLAVGCPGKSLIEDSAKALGLSREQVAFTAKGGETIGFEG